MKYFSKLGVFVLGLSVISALEVSGDPESAKLSKSPSMVDLSEFNTTNQGGGEEQGGISAEDTADQEGTTGQQRAASQEEIEHIFGRKISDDVKDNLTVYYRLMNAFGYRTLKNRVRVFDISHRTLVDYAQRKIIDHIKEINGDLYNEIQVKLKTESASKVYEKFCYNNKVVIDSEYNSLMTVIDDIVKLDKIETFGTSDVESLKAIILNEDNGIITIEGGEDFKAIIDDAFDVLISNRSGRHLLEKFLILNELKKLGDDIGSSFEKIKIRSGSHSEAGEDGVTINPNDKDEYLFLPGTTDTKPTESKDIIASSLMHELCHKYHIYLKGKKSNEGLAEFVYGMLRVPSVAKQLNPFLKKEFYDEFVNKTIEGIRDSQQTGDNEFAPISKNVSAINSKVFEGIQQYHFSDFVEKLKEKGYTHLEGSPSNSNMSLSYMGKNPEQAKEFVKYLYTGLCVAFFVSWDKDEEALTIAGAAPVCYREKDGEELKTFVITDDQNESTFRSRGYDHLRMSHWEYRTILGLNGKLLEKPTFNLMNALKLSLTPSKTEMNDIKKDMGNDKVTVGLTDEEKIACLNCLRRADTTGNIHLWYNLLNWKKASDSTNVSNEMKELIRTVISSGNLELLEKLSTSDDWKGMLESQYPLHLALEKGHLDMVKYLVKICHCNVEAKDNEGKTPLYIAAAKNNSSDNYLNIVKYLVEGYHAQITPKIIEFLSLKTNRNGVDAYLSEELEKFFSEIIGSGDLKQVDNLLDNGFVKDDRGNTLLHYAAKLNKLDVVEHLVTECKLDGRAVNRESKTPLHIAAENGHLEIVKYLVEDADDIPTLPEDYDYVDPKDLQGRTPLHLAAENGHFDTVQYLVDYADPYAKDFEDKTPLHLAALGGHIEIVKCLVGEGSDVKAKDKNGRTALHLAALGGTLDMVKYLVKECHAQITEEIINIAGTEEIKNYLRSQKR